MSEKTDRARRDLLRGLLLAGAAAPFAGFLAGCGRGEDDAADVSNDGAGVTVARVARRPLGRTGFTVPILLIGGGASFNLRYDKLLHRAFAAGVNYLDTAMVYSEGLSHRAIARFTQQVGRDKLWITSKGRPSSRTPEEFERDIDLCLSQLETTWLDMYFMQAVEDPRRLDAEYLAMGERLRKRGKTRLFGFSCCGANLVALLEKAAASGGIDAIMFRYSFARLEDLALNRAIDRCRAAGIGLIAMKTQNSTPRDPALVREFRSRRFTLGQAKLKAVWADERIDAVVSLMNNTRLLAENVAAATAAERPTAAAARELRRVAAETAALCCQGCAEICEARVAAPLRIAKTLRCLAYHECYGEPEHAHRVYDELRPEERAFDGVDFSAASAACPQGIDIAARIAAARRVLEA